jgi:branched-chain amino acid transport system ATP-binding protein
MLEVRELSKRFGKVVTADRISFSIEKGAALGVVGPNGAGKTTLLSMISGVLPSDAGTIRFDGRDLGGEPAGRRAGLGISRTFQIPRPFVDMTVFENVLVAAAYGGGRRGQARHDTAAGALEITGLRRLANEQAGRLRLLDRKRLELARALATGPRLLLLDEIAGGLTEKELPPLIELIRVLGEQGVTIIWIEHIVHALLAVVDELMCLAFGKILAIGEPRTVMSSPEVIDSYLGSTVDVEETA